MIRSLEEKYFPIIEKLMSSGLTAKAYSEQYRIITNMFTYRKKRCSDHNRVELKEF
ncbi:MAG: hypothetical protein KBF32_09685 [Chitinophagales bacterium]|jgi:hypothetical protein|nr:hypothetical protein [Chitinophagales bacterium]